MQVCNPKRAAFDATRSQGQVIMSCVPTIRFFAFFLTVFAFFANFIAPALAHPSQPSSSLAMMRQKFLTISNRSIAKGQIVTVTDVGSRPVMPADQVDQCLPVPSLAVGHITRCDIKKDAILHYADLQCGLPIDSTHKAMAETEVKKALQKWSSSRERFDYDRNLVQVAQVVRPIAKGTRMSAQDLDSRLIYLTCFADGLLASPISAVDRRADKSFKAGDFLRYKDFVTPISMDLSQKLALKKLLENCLKKWQSEIDLREFRAEFAGGRLNGVQP